jgi:hypothetical protein
MDNQQWLKSLKKGDVIAIPGSGLREGDYTEVIVKSISPTGRITVTYKKNPDYEVKFSEHGREIGGQRWSIQSLVPITEEMKAARFHNGLLSRIKNTEWDKLPTDVLKQVYTLVKENQSKPNES